MPGAAPRAVDTPESRPAFWRCLGAARLALGGIFLWAFLDKLLGLGYATPAARAWLNGGSPTKGYLGSSTGPLAGLFHAMAGNPVADVLFMLGLLAVGACLLLGVGVRVASAAGALMLLMMYASHPPWATAASSNPAIDDHVVYAAVLLAFASSHAGRSLGLGGWWARRTFVARHPWME